MTTSPVVSVTDELVAELEYVAKRATKGEWWIDSHGHTMVSHDSGVTHTVFQAMDIVKPADRHPETGNLSHWPNDWDASYIATASPATILALLSERAELKRDAERYRWLRMADWWDSHLCVVKDPKTQAKPGTDCPSRDRLDSAIDAAMQSEAKP